MTRFGHPTVGQPGITDSTLTNLCHAHYIRFAGVATEASGLEIGCVLKRSGLRMQLTKKGRQILIRTRSSWHVARTYSLLALLRDLGQRPFVPSLWEDVSLLIT